MAGYKKTDQCIQIGTRNAVVYEGQRGGKYIRTDGKYVLVSSLKKPTHSVCGAGSRPVQSIIMDLEGDITRTSELHDGKPFFRKTFVNITLPLPPKNTSNRHAYEQAYSHRIEHAIYQRIKAHRPPLPNLVKVYNITDTHVDIELLDMPITYMQYPEAHKAATLGKDQLQSIGVMYIDWKMDNMGISKDKARTYKIFDFDVSGIVKKEDPDKWEMEPLHYYNYNKVFKVGLSPKEIDDATFKLLPSSQ